MVEISKFSSLFAILSYCGSSILMTLVNKFVLDKFKKPSIVFFMLAIQAFFSVALVMLFGKLKLLNYRSFKSDEGKKWLPVSVLMAVMLFTGGKSLEHLPVHLFTIFKNLTIVFVAYGEKYIFNAKVTPLMLASFFLMILGSVIGGGTDLNFNPVGYFWMTANCISSALFVLYLRKAIKTVSFKDFDTVYYNNLLTFPIFIVMSMLLEDWPQLYQFYWDPENSDLYFGLLKGLVISGISAFAISYTSAWCIRVTNSTTYSMTGALNKLPVAIFGMIYFGNPPTFGNMTAIFTGFGSGIIYTRAKILQQRMNAAQTSAAANDYTPVDSDEKDRPDGTSILPTQSTGEQSIPMDELEKGSVRRSK